MSEDQIQISPAKNLHDQIHQGDVRWVSDDQVLSAEPARSVWQRVEDLVFMMFPRDLYEVLLTNSRC